ncbi:MAG: septal ring lytic transglycosylase RlpA family protein [Bacteroidota bacterium]
MRFQIKHKIGICVLAMVTFYTIGAKPVSFSIETPTIQADSLPDSSTVTPRFRQTGVASYYANKFHGRRTSSGERYSKNKLTAAHRTLPFGTLVKVTEVKTGKWLIVRINDRGPHTRKRIIDLSYEAARQLGMVKGKGLLKVRIRVVEWPK